MLGPCLFPSPISQLCVSSLIVLLSIAQGGLEVLMPQSFANGWQAYLAVDELSCVRMPQLVERAGYSCL